MWHVEQMQKGDNDMSLPRFLGKSRTVLKFTNTAMQKCLSTSDFHKIVLESNYASKKEMKKTAVACLPQMKKIFKLMVVLKIT